MNYKDLLLSASSKLSRSNKKANIIVGFDGYVDEIIHVVDKRISNKDFKRIKTINDFSVRIAKAAGLSANIELVSQQVKLGGNGPILANALLEQNHEIIYMGAIGKDSIHPVFQEFASKCQKVISWAEPGHTDALEFQDGKLMFGKSSDLININWDELLKKISKEQLEELLSNSQLICITNWNSLTELNSIFIGFNEILKNKKSRPYVFIDLADPQKRTNEDIKKVIKLISELNKNASVIFGMNKNESAIIAKTLAIEESDIKERAQKIRHKMDIDFAVIHPLEGAAASGIKGDFWVDGPYTDNPKLTTGAGDNFNSGFCNGLLNGLSIEESLAIGVFTSGFYVRKCHSPNKSELVTFMQDWASKL